MNPERFHRLAAVLDARQLDLTVLLDNVHKPHNVSAILRSCDATGIYRVHAVWPTEHLPKFHLTSGGSHRWVDVRTHSTLPQAFSSLRATGMRILAAHPGPDATGRPSTDYRSVDYTRPTALLLGAELNGIAPEALAEADGCITIPMHGLVTSLNVSVAAALILFEAARQRSEANLYARPQIDPESRAHTLFEWAYPELAEHCRKHEHPYPRLDSDGEMLDPIPR